MKIIVEMEVEDIDDYKYLQPVVSSQIKMALNNLPKLEDMELTYSGVNCSSKITIDLE